jgi:hypothetical protein
MKPLNRGRHVCLAGFLGDRDAYLTLQMGWPWKNQIDSLFLARY